MKPAHPALTLTESGAASDTFLLDVLTGLQQPQKALPSKYFYDEWGSVLFDRITELDEYYPTRTELGIMEACIDEMVALIGPDVRLIEYGSGSSLKTRILLDHLVRPTAYVPIDISCAYLYQTAETLAGLYPNIPIQPVCADYTRSFALPEPVRPALINVVYFPGSTIGNFDPKPARGFLQRVATVCGPGGGLLIGVDLKKDIEVLERAYNDEEGITAAFNLNLLRRINREFGADFDLDRFDHQAVYNPAKGRIEMYIVSREPQRVHVADVPISFEAGETIYTEASHKYTFDEFADLARGSFHVVQVWTDADQLFSVQYLQAR